MDVEPSNETATPSGGPKPHDFLWFRGGDVILSTNVHLFKVHKDILSIQSSVFRDMFELPSRSNDTSQAVDSVAGIVPETFEGLPHIAIVGDDPKYIEHLLRTVYERQYYDRDDDQTPLEVIIALLTLSTKYDFPHIRREVIKQISKHYPMTLDAYGEIDVDWSLLFGVQRYECHLPILRALFKSDVGALLPIAFYACADFGMDSLLESSRDLDVGCLQILLKGRERLLEETGRLLVELPGMMRDIGAVIGCRNINDQSCSVGARFIDLADVVLCSDLQDFEGEKIASENTSYICPTCADALRDKINTFRGTIWHAVPSYFGYPSWEVLQGQLEEFD